jgi:cytochrome P450
MPAFMRAMFGISPSDERIGQLDHDLIAELAILIAGGYETVVASVSWTLALLATNPEALQRLIDEVDTLEGAAPQYADLNRLTWVKACFDEGQRLQGHPSTHESRCKTTLSMAT